MVNKVDIKTEYIEVCRYAEAYNLIGVTANEVLGKRTRADDVTDSKEFKAEKLEDYFDWLPDEIIYEILSYLHVDQLIKVQLVSRRFRGISREIIQKKSHLITSEKLRLFVRFDFLQASELPINGVLKAMNSKFAIVNTTGEDFSKIDLKTGKAVVTHLWTTDSVIDKVLCFEDDFYFAQENLLVVINKNTVKTFIDFEYDSTIDIKQVTKSGIVLYQSPFDDEEEDEDSDGELPKYPEHMRIVYLPRQIERLNADLKILLGDLETIGCEGSRRIVFKREDKVLNALILNDEGFLYELDEESFDDKNCAIQGDDVINIEFVFELYPHLRGYKYNPFVKSNCIFFEKEKEFVIVNISNRELFTFGKVSHELFIHEEWACATIEVDSGEKMNIACNLIHGKIVDLSPKVKGVIRGYHSGKIITDSMIYDFC